MFPTPRCHCIEQSLADLKIVDEIDITKSTETMSGLLVISRIDEACNTSYRLTHIVDCHEENRVAKP